MNQFQEASSPKILIIDDDLDLLMLLERRLLKEGYEVETAASLNEAEEILGYFPPQLVLLDININGDDGRQLCWKLKKTSEENGIRVLLISGYDADRARGALFGADDVLPKPIHTEYLVTKIAEYLNQPQKESI